ncbi:MAG: YgjV family protein [Ruminococcaceae bacterium]|nr:YgjV family protein [Oscillospiraceae bacterium]
MNQIIVQGIGVLALICSLISFQQKKRIWLMIFHMSASILSAVQLFLLGAYAGAALDLIAFIRTLIFSFGNRFMRMGLGTWRAIFLGQMLVAGALTFTDIYSLLAILAGCLSTVALSMKKDFHVRLISLLYHLAG